MSRTVIFAVASFGVVAVLLFYKFSGQLTYQFEAAAEMKKNWNIVLERINEAKTLFASQRVSGSSETTQITKNKDIWEGLKPEKVSQRWKGLTLDGTYALREFVDPNDPRAFGMGRKPKTIANMTDADAEERFHQLVVVQHLQCEDMKRMGKRSDGGWDICLSGPYKPKKGCIVYSYGINYDFSFDDAMGKDFHCQVKAYDPSMKKTEEQQRSEYVYFYKIGLGGTDTTNNKGWKLLTLESALKQNNHTDKIIDYLKMDIESNEWASLEEILPRGTLKYVKQFSFEIHMGEKGRNRQSKYKYLKAYNILLELEKQGFRRYHYHFNRYCRFKSALTGKIRTTCHELYYVNINYLKT